jgi:hypothetical protein
MRELPPPDESGVFAGQNGFYVGICGAPSEVAPDVDDFLAELRCREKPISLTTNPSLLSRVRLDPVPQVGKGFRCAPAQRGQGVFNVEGNFGIHGAVDQSVVFELSQCLGRTLELTPSTVFSHHAKAQRPPFQRANGQGGPLVGQQIQHVTAGARRHVDVVPYTGISTSSHHSSVVTKGN